MKLRILNEGFWDNAYNAAKWLKNHPVIDTAISSLLGGAIFSAGGAITGNDALKSGILGAAISGGVSALTHYLVHNKIIKDPTEAYEKAIELNKKIEKLQDSGRIQLKGIIDNDEIASRITDKDKKIFFTNMIIYENGKKLDINGLKNSSVIEYCYRIFGYDVNLSEDFRNFMGKKVIFLGNIPDKELLNRVANNEFNGKFILIVVQRNNDQIVNYNDLSLYNENNNIPILMISNDGNKNIKDIKKYKNIIFNICRNNQNNSKI